MLCHGKPLSCAKKSKTVASLPAGDDGDSEGEDMYGFLPKKLTVTPACIRRENIYEAAPRKAAAAAATTTKVVTFLDEPPQVRVIQRRHSCAEDYRGYASAKFDRRPPTRHPIDPQPQPQLRCTVQPPSSSHQQQQQQQSQNLSAQLPPSLAYRSQFAHRWSSGSAGNSVCGHYWRRMLPPSPPSTPRPSAAWRPPPPGYHVAVRRAASFSASRGINANRLAVGARPPGGHSFASSTGTRPHPPQSRPLRPVDPVKCGGGGGGDDGASSNLRRAASSSTSDLYVDSSALKRAQSRDLLSVASSTSSMSEATVYRKIGPCDYVSVCDTPCRKSFASRRHSSDDRAANSSSTDLENGDQSRKEIRALNIPRTDTYRFSMANLEDTQDVDLDAILGELSALESQYKDVADSSPRNSSNGSDISSCYRRTTSISSPQSGAVMRTESPDNDSAFSDSISLISSESSTSSSTALSTRTNQVASVEDSKTEKIKLALRKMKEANVTKLFVKIFGKDGGAKSLLVDENMKCGYVMKLLADKHHMPLSPRWGLVEYLPELYMERVYEEHEPLVENLMLWTRESKNKLFFVERPERLLFFERPEIYHPEYNSISTLEDELSQNALVEEYSSAAGLPTVEGPLYIKLDSKKGWKKYNAVLRASGLYYYKEKTMKSSKDLVCLATFDVNQVYYGVGWKKKFKAPTEHCFAIKHPCLQQPKSTKYIKYLCTEDAFTLHKWVTAIRIIKYGRQLLENYQSSSTIDECDLSDSGSSGCDVAFESDFPCGTIKRKPPKLPLTATTRQLASLDVRVANNALLERTPSFASLPPPPPELLASTLTLNEDPVDLPPPPPPPRMLPPPSQSFLLDLQRVMRRKWQVAQKCKQDLNVTPHEVLGFRDPPDYKETNVSNWVAEHYGGGQNLYENVYRCGGGAVQQQPAAPAIVSASPSSLSFVTPKVVNVAPVGMPAQRPSSSTLSSSSSSNAGTPVKKRPPPPPPPRAETTVLTTATVRSSPNYC